MIPSTNTKLRVTEDWKKIYQSFRNADFKSYDFETLRRTMISYLQENYPENFNDYIDSSEYIALIDLIAYLGQNLSFRIDLNARENFLETAQRRDSVIRLAQLISYKVTRNVPGNGFLKLTAISTTDNVFDSNGVNLANTTIGWNDPVNPEWYQQFINIVNSSMVSAFGNPIDKKSIDGIITEQYRINSVNTDVPIFTFSRNLNGISMGFEIVPCTFSEKDFVYEEAPRPAGQFSFIYKNDNQGSGSINTGFFVHFRQGSLNVSNFTIDNPVPNEIIGVNTPDINDTDVWLWQLDNSGNYSNLWTQVPSTSGNYNVIYNSLNNDIRSIYSVSTRENDQIDLNFADGIFGDLPKGQFRLFYRQSNGQQYTIKPEQMTGISITVPYKNTSGQEHTLTLILSLQYSVTNSAGTESISNIQNKAPQAYYLQNRMITGEDYNIAPLNAGSDILKVKSINRISSGVSKYFDIADVSGRYSQTNIFAADGILYKEKREEFFEFEFTNINQVLAVIKNKLSPVISDPALKSFVFDSYPNFELSSLSLTWTEVNKTPNQSRGYLSNETGVYSVGAYTDNNLRYLKAGALVKFVAPSGKYFDKKHNLKTIPTAGIPVGGVTYIWATVAQVIRDGANNGAGALDDGTGPIIFNTRVPSGAIASEITPKFINTLDSSLENEIANLCLSQRNFGLTVDQIDRTWNVILNLNLDIVNPFSLTNQNNTDNTGADSSWIILFVWTGKNYKVTYRILNYIFESKQETSFYIDKSSFNYDYITNSVVKDKIEVLSVNAKSTSTESLGVDYVWQIDGAIVEPDGYIDPTKIKISLYEDNFTGQITDPESFKKIVQPDTINYETGFRDKFVYFKLSSDGQRYDLFEESDVITAYPTEAEFNLSNVDLSLVDDNSLYYFYDSAIDAVKYWSTASSSLVYTNEYVGREGRSDLKFRYLHNSSDNRRIDPSKSNIIDVYVLTVSYDTEFKSWLLGSSAQEPVSPTSQSLEQNYGEYLNSIKAISDEIIFHPVKYKILFGSKADLNLQAKFKAVRNPDIPTTDNDLKTKILNAINNFFALENWDFGQSFYFSELATYVMNSLTPNITNFIIVPVGDKNFGSYYEIACQSDEIFINGAGFSDIDIIDAVTASELKTTNIVTSSGT